MPSMVRRPPPIRRRRPRRAPYRSVLQRFAHALEVEDVHDLGIGAAQRRLALLLLPGEVAAEAERRHEGHERVEGGEAHAPRRPALDEPLVAHLVTVRAALALG